MGRYFWQSFRRLMCGGFSWAAVIVCSLAMAQQAPQAAGAGGDKSESIEIKSWKLRYDPTKLSEREEWQRPDFSEGEWDPVQVPAPINDKYDGIVWYRTTIEVPRKAKLNPDEKLEDQPKRVLLFEQVDDQARVYVNGELAAENTSYNKPFYVELDRFIGTGSTTVRTDGVETEVADDPGPKKLLIAVRVLDLGKEGGILNPVRLVTTTKPQELYKTEYSSQQAPHTLDELGGIVMYSVYVRNFSSEGTFKALEAKLPELKALGVNTLWLLPIHQIGDKARKGPDGSPYAIKDYYSIDPALGTKEDFRALVKAAHAQGMRLIIDCVLNHTSPDSVLAREHKDWFRLNKEGEPVASNPDWSDIVDLNWKKREVWDYCFGFLEYWVREFDIDGYRADVADAMPGDFWKELRGRLDKIRPNKILMLAESDKPEKLLQGFDIIYNQSIRDAAINAVTGKGNAAAVRQAAESTYGGIPQGGAILLFVENHDKERAINAYGSADAEKAGAVLTATLPGVPLLYTGTEVGAAAKRNDTFFKRTPVEWSDQAGMRKFWTDLLKTRAEQKALQTGELKWINTAGASPDVIAFQRGRGDEAVTVAVNLGKKPVSLKMSSSAGPKADKDMSLGPYGWRIVPARQVASKFPAGSIKQGSQQRR